MLDGRACQSLMEVRAGLAYNMSVAVSSTRLLCRGQLNYLTFDVHANLIRLLIGLELIDTLRFYSLCVILRYLLTTVR